MTQTHHSFDGNERAPSSLGSSAGEISAAFQEGRLDRQAFLRIALGDPFTHLMAQIGSRDDKSLDALLPAFPAGTAGGVGYQLVQSLMLPHPEHGQARDLECFKAFLRHGLAPGADLLQMTMNLSRCLPFTRLLLEAGGDANAKMEPGLMNTLLKVAAFQESPAAVELLVEHGVRIPPINDPDQPGPLELAMFLAHHDTCEALMRAGARTHPELVAPLLMGKPIDAKSLALMARFEALDLAASAAAPTHAPTRRPGL